MQNLCVLLCVSMHVCEFVQLMGMCSGLSKMACTYDRQSSHTVCVYECVVLSAQCQTENTQPDRDTPHASNCHAEG